MKNLFVVTIFAICAMMLVGTVSAQPKMEIGVKTGLNFASVKGDMDNVAGITTFGGGMFVRITSLPQISIQTELLYIVKGYETENANSYTMKLTYLEVPALIMFNLPIDGKIKPSVFAGPAVSFMLKANYNTQDIKEAMKKFDLGLVFGSNINFNLSKSANFTLDGRYTLGFIEYNNLNSEEKNGVFSISVGFIFPIALD